MKSKGQVWIEVVIYTLMAMTMMGIVLGIVKPALDERKDALVASQSVDILNAIDMKISEVKYVPGNSRNMQIKISKGKMIIDGKGDNIRMIIEGSKYAKSEPNLTINEGNVVILTTQNGKLYDITLTLNYTGKLNITYKGSDNVGTLQYAPTPYNLAVRNNGGQPYNIDFF